jgi:hypothetical protein
MKFPAVGRLCHRVPVRSEALEKIHRYLTMEKLLISECRTENYRTFGVGLAAEQLRLVDKHSH